MDLFIGIGFNVIIALILNVLVLFLLGFCFHLFSAKLSRSVTSMTSIIITTGIGFLTFVTFFQQYCLRFTCDRDEFFAGIILVAFTMLVIGYFGHVAMNLGYGKTNSNLKH